MIQDDEKRVEIRVLVTPATVAKLNDYLKRERKLEPSLQFGLAAGRFLDVSAGDQEI